MPAVSRTVRTPAATAKPARTTKSARLMRESLLLNAKRAGTNAKQTSSPKAKRKNNQKAPMSAKKARTKKPPDERERQIKHKSA
jgi:hypothetical protein